MAHKEPGGSEALSAQAQAIIEKAQSLHTMYSTMGQKMDFGTVWTDPDFKGLTEAEQKKVRAELKDLGAEEEPPKPFNAPRIKGRPPKFPDAPVPTPADAPKVAEPKARIERTRDRKREELPQAEYVIENRDRELVVVDKKFQKVKDGKGNEVLDEDNKPKREWKTYETDIVLPVAVQVAYDRDPNSPEVKEVLAKAQAIRQELEFDKKRKVQNLEAFIGTDGWPMWKIKIGPFSAEESWDIKDFSPGLQRMAERGLEWFLKSDRFQEFVAPNSASWNEWLNKAKRKVIERIISEELEEPKRTKVEKPAAKPPAEPVAPKTVEPEPAPAPVVEPKPAAVVEPKPPEPAKIEPAPKNEEKAKLMAEFEASLGGEKLEPAELMSRYYDFMKERAPAAAPAPVEKKVERARISKEKAKEMKEKIEQHINDHEEQEVVEKMKKTNPKSKKKFTEAEAKEAVREELKGRLARMRADAFKKIDDMIE